MIAELLPQLLVLYFFLTNIFWLKLMQLADIHFADWNETTLDKHTQERCSFH